jgi:hypothetical protein
MKLSRPSRFVAALIALFSVLYMQFAVASYACPGLTMAHASEAVAMAADAGDESMDGCTGMDKEQPSLCHAYDQAGNQSVDKPGVPPVQAFTPVALVLTLVTTTDTAILPIHEQTESFLLTRTTAPPLSIRNCCFRI